MPLKCLFFAFFTMCLLMVQKRPCKNKSNQNGFLEPIQQHKNPAVVAECLEQQLYNLQRQQAILLGPRFKSSSGLQYKIYNIYLLYISMHISCNITIQISLRDCQQIFLFIYRSLYIKKMISHFCQIVKDCYGNKDRLFQDG